EELAARIREAGGECELVRADLSDPDGAEALAREVAERFGPVDVLINNAGGMLERSDPEKVSRELWQRTFDLNVTSLFLLTRARRSWPPASGRRGASASWCGPTCPIPTGLRRWPGRWPSGSGRWTS